MVYIGERLKSLRTKNKMTQQQVAEIIHVSRPTYTQYEKNQKRPSIETLIRLADLYETSIDYLVGRY